MNKNLLNILEYAYKNDVVSTRDFKPEILNNLYINGFLENPHLNKNKFILYWVTLKGIELLKKEKVV